MAGQVDLTEKQDGGVLKEILRAGEGDATPGEGCDVFVHYHGTLLDGTVFDSSRDRGQEFEFKLGMGQVIRSWDIVVATMKKGELCRLTCAAEYAYGATGSPPKIPANATLVFEVELLRWSYEDISPEKDGSLQKRVVTKGELYSKPTDLSECTVHLRGTTTQDGKVFDERDVVFVVGEAALKGVCAAVELAVQQMKKGEKSDIYIKAGSRLATDEHLPKPVAGQDITYTLTLHNFEKAKEVWEMNSDEKLAAADSAKERGTDHFKEGRLDQALKYYKRVRTLVKDEDRLEGDDRKRRDTLMLSALLNLALVHLKLDDHLECVSMCDEALALEANNVKALFRRGQAQLAVNEFEAAVADFDRCLAVEPDNKAAQSQRQLAKAKAKAQLDREKKMFQAMFQKMAGSGGPSNADKGNGATEEGVWNEEAAAAPVEAN